MPTSISITNEDFGWLLKKQNAKFHGAYLSETQGPNYKPIVWVIRGGVRTPFVCESHSIAQIRKLLNQ